MMHFIPQLYDITLIVTFNLLSSKLDHNLMCDIINHSEVVQMTFQVDHTVL